MNKDKWLDRATKRLACDIAHNCASEDVCKIDLESFASAIIQECLRPRTIDEQWGGKAPEGVEAVSAKPCPFCGCEVKVINSDDPCTLARVDHPAQATLWLHPCVLSGTTWPLARWNERG